MKRAISALVVMVMVTVISCQRNSTVSNEKIFTRDQIKTTTEQYAEINQADLIEVWEKELGGRWFSKYVKVMAEKTIGMYPERKVQLKTDIYLPPDEGGYAPFILFIHGGAFITGKRNSPHMRKLCMEFAQRGYKVASIDYRRMSLLNPSAVKAAYTALQDARTALDYFVQHSNRLKIDTDNMFLGGLSAGACTALHLAYYERDEPFLGRRGKLDEIYGAVDANCMNSKPDIKGVINVGGGIFDIRMMDNAIPCISYHGTDDRVIDIEYDYPFKSKSEDYNQTLDDIQKLFDRNPTLSSKLEEAKMFKVYGSAKIHERLSEIDEELSMFTPYPGTDHYLLFSTNDNFTSLGLEIIDDLSGKLYSLVQN